VPQIFPFEGLVFDEAVSGPLDRVTSPPYDVINADRRRELMAASEFAVIHLDLADGHDDVGSPGNRYERAAALLTDWERRGALLRTGGATYHAYEMQPRGGDGPRSAVRGLLCAMALEPWGGSVLPHERTMEGPVQDRLSLLRATRTHVSPVYGTIAGPCPELADLLAEVCSQPAPFATMDDEGVLHRMWPVGPRAEIAAWIAGRPVLIADGHHRYTTALAYQQERNAADGPGLWDRVLTLIVDAAVQRLAVLPFHRIQRGGPAWDGLGVAVPDLTASLAGRADEPARVGLVTREAGRPVYRVVQLRGGPPAVRALHDELLDPGVEPTELSFHPNAAVADAAVRDGTAVAAWLLPATTPARIQAVVEGGERLPQKSTFFWPKPRTGMVMMPLDAAPAGISPAAPTHRGRAS
jgi:uncharacterized protein (DUF1015 family)